MSFRLHALLCLAIAAIGGASAADTMEQSFLRANATAMDRMMRAMSVKPSGNVDADFVNMMEPHHQGAVKMAELELRYGTNEHLRRIAQEIIVDQQQEIVAMRLALGRSLPAMKAAPDEERPSHSMARMPAH